MSTKYKDYIKTEICDNKDLNIIQFLKILYYSPSKEAVFLLRTYLYLSEHNKLPRLGLYYKKKLIYKFNIYISRNSKVGLGIQLPHPTSIVIGSKAVIGENNIIYQNVTFGRKKINGNGYPNTKSNCTFFANSVIVGNISVESNTTVGANSVLMQDTLKNGIYAGNPAKLIKLSKCDE